MNASTNKVTKPAKLAEVITSDPISVAREASERAASLTSTRRAERARAGELAAEARSAAKNDPSKRDAFVAAEADERLAGDRLRDAEDDQRRCEETLARLVRERAEQEHAAGLVRAAAWADRLHLAFAKLDALDQERATVIDLIADGVLLGQGDFDATLEIERTLAPLDGLRERAIDRPSMQTALYLAQVYLTHVRSAAGRDALPDQLIAQPIPAWDSPHRPAFERAAAILGIHKKEESK